MAGDKRTGNPSPSPPPGPLGGGRGEGKWGKVAMFPIRLDLRRFPSPPPGLYLPGLYKVERGPGEGFFPLP